MYFWKFPSWWSSSYILYLSFEICLSFQIRMGCRFFLSSFFSEFCCSTVRPLERYVHISVARSIAFSMDTTMRAGFTLLKSFEFSFLPQWLWTYQVYWNWVSNEFSKQQQKSSCIYSGHHNDNRLADMMLSLVMVWYGMGWYGMGWSGSLHVYAWSVSWVSLTMLKYCFITSKPYTHSIMSNITADSSVVPGISSCSFFASLSSYLC